MKKLIPLVALVLSGCQTADVQMLTVKEQVVITPSESMYNCPTISSLPDPKTLTDLQVAKLLFELNKNNSVCKNSITSIKKYLEEAKKTVEKK